MKFLKKLAIACLTLTMFAGLASFAACGDTNDNGNGTSNNQPAQTETFKFKILKADGSPAVGYVVQLCERTCAFSEPANENGEVSCAGADGEVSYAIHVFTANPTKGGKQVSHTGATHTPAKYSEEVIVLTLND